MVLPSSLLREALSEASFRYKKIYIRKKSGGTREMVQPSIKLKPILTWIESVILSQLEISTIATAFCPGSSVVKNAAAHRDSPYSVRVDLSNFFHSIKTHDLLSVIAKANNSLPAWMTSSGIKELISTACFDSSERLPIGYSTSPKIANVVMLDLDKSLLRKISDKSVFGNAVLTRYADDFVFSTNKKGACRAFYLLLEELLKNTDSPKLTINSDKTRFMSLKGGSTLITGLRLKQNSEIGVHPNYRDHVRLFLKLYSANKLKYDDIASLRGHIAFIKHADPALITKLSYKYHSQIAELSITKLNKIESK